MDAEQFSQLVAQIKIGKQLPEAIYLHKDAFSALPTTLSKFILAVAKALNHPDKLQLIEK
ncbi:hypothetical protein B9J90_09340 [Vibrio sp. V09_P4A23P171]|uniref:hypothetical protein n=1 Tax=Vibrio sp. V09_P4A23P171 TaxID=1938664 RepID=UPI000B8E8EA8|nr:hypothetical protein [Vibrio sp. V09_P4A23P171]OXX35889.1 hypothetical protein B9J90_09340 [Vibrio sp. V09_P4A23P171]